jgi:hypothetical protein
MEVGIRQHERSPMRYLLSQAELDVRTEAIAIVNAIANLGRGMSKCGIVHLDRDGPTLKRVDALLERISELDAKEAT